MANLPYNVSVPVLLTFFERFASIRTGLVMVQAEVAHRLAAGPGSKTYGIPSVKSAWYADMKLSGSVGRNVFWPMPNVESSLVGWTRHEPPGDEELRLRTFAVADAAFAQRRKTMRAALATLAGSGALAEKALVAAGISPQARGEQLTVQEFARLAQFLCPGVHRRSRRGQGRREPAMPPRPVAGRRAAGTSAGEGPRVATRLCR